MSKERVTLFDGTTSIAFSAFITALLGTWAWIAADVVDLPETVSVGDTLQIPVVVVLPLATAMLTIWLARKPIWRRLQTYRESDKPESDSDEDSIDESATGSGEDHFNEGESAGVEQVGDDPRQREESFEAHPDAPDSAIPGLEDDKSGGDTGNGSEGPSAGSVDIDLANADCGAPGPADSSGQSETAEGDTQSDDDDDDDSSPANPVTERDISRYGDRKPID